MAKGSNRTIPTNSSRQIPQTRLYDDASLDTRYELLNKLGEGSFGMVSRVRSRDNHLFYAMKTIAKKPGNKSKASSLDNEVKLLTEVNHPNLIQLYEVLESSQNLYLIVELCEGGELGGYVKKNGSLPEETVKQIMSKLINALHYLHKMDIVHRDLKLDNILLRNIPTSKTDEFDIRVTDFGLSSKKSITSTDSLFNDYCGTPLYMAPEILENKNYSALCDVWAMGIIMYYLISGRHPYVANDERRLLEVIRSQKLRFDSDKFQNLSPQGLDFLQGMLVYDTVHRRTMGELTAHPWLTGRSDKEPVKDIITMMREFQAETDRHQETNENKIVTIETVNIPPTINEQEITNPMKINSNRIESRNLVEKNKFNMKSVSRLTCDTIGSRRSTHDSQNSLSTIHVRVKPNDKMSMLTNSNQIRQSFIGPSSISVTKTRTTAANVRRGRSQSYADLHLPSKFSPTRHASPQRTVFNDAIQVDDSSIFLPPSNEQLTATLGKTPLSATATALMMINKQYTAPCLPPVITHHQPNTKSMSFYQKRFSNHT